MHLTYLAQESCTDTMQALVTLHAYLPKKRLRDMSKALGMLQIYLAQESFTVESKNTIRI